jgi:hypothetical protein
MLDSRIVQMADDFVDVLLQASHKQNGHKFLLIYYILNPKVYSGELPLTNETEIITFYPVGTYRTFNEAFKVLVDIMKKIETGRFKIIHIGTSSTLTNVPTKSVLNTMWDKLSTEQLSLAHQNELNSVTTIDKAKEEATKINIDDPDSIEYLRDNFSNLCFNNYALQRCDEQHRQIIEAIELRKANCWKYLETHPVSDFDVLKGIYEERLPKRGESHLVNFFTEHISNMIDGVPKILHKNETE